MGTKQLGSISALMQSFYSEFFGTFVPGFIAVVSVASAFMVAAIYWGFVDKIDGLENFVEAMLDKPGLISILSSWLVLGVVCAVSYAVGAIIYRRAPKIPDAIASYRQWRKTSDRERDLLAVDFSRLTKSSDVKIGIAGWPFWKGDAIREKFGKQIDYPYPHLRQYLGSRGHRSLLKYVPWCSDLRNLHTSEKMIQERSKTQINIIKQLVIAEGSSALSRDLVRNESHIRLLSSLWYIFRFLQELFTLFISLEIIFVVRYFVLGLSVTSVPFRVTWSTPTSNMQLLTPFLVFAIGFFFVWFLKRNIVICFHYVRTREIVMALHAAEILHHEAIEKNRASVLFFFNEIRKRNDTFTNKYCKKCRRRRFCGGKA